MKKLCYALAILLAATCLFSCSNDDIVTIPNDSAQWNAIERVFVDGKQISKVNDNTRTVTDENYVLRFGSEAIYQSTLDKLEKMSNDERLEFAKSFGIISLQELAKIADEELEVIGNSATSEGDFRTQYAAYKERYEGLLISNLYDLEDLTLYVPDGDEVSTYLVNKECIIVIEDEIRKVTLSNDMSESDKSIYVPRPATRGITKELNYFQAKTSSKKTTCSVKTVEKNILVAVHIGFQKKMWYGWKNDNAREPYFIIQLSNYTGYYMGEKEGHIILGNPIYWFTARSSIDFITGHVNNNNIPSTGKIYVWTDMTAGPELVSYPSVAKNGKDAIKRLIPKLDDSNAYSCDLRLN